MNEKINVDEFSDGFDNVIRTAMLFVVLFGIIWNVML